MRVTGWKGDYAHGNVPPNLDARIKGALRPVSRSVVAPVNQSADGVTWAENSAHVGGRGLRLFLKIDAQGRVPYSPEPSRCSTLLTAPVHSPPRGVRMPRRRRRYPTRPSTNRSGSTRATTPSSSDSPHGRRGLLNCRPDCFSNFREAITSPPVPPLHARPELPRNGH